MNFLEYVQSSKEKQIIYKKTLSSKEKEHLQCAVEIFCFLRKLDTKFGTVTIEEQIQNKFNTLSTGDISPVEAEAIVLAIILNTNETRSITPVIIDEIDDKHKFLAELMSHSIINKKWTYINILDMVKTLQYIPENSWTMELSLLIVKLVPEAIDYIPDKYITNEMRAEVDEIMNY